MISYGDRLNDYESVSKCRQMLGAPPVTPSDIVSVTDFRNKFGALHQSHTPNRERELFSECRDPVSRAILLI